MTSARWLSTTYCSAFMNCVKPCTPSVSAVGVVTSRMFAAGAVACAHSMSSDTSSAQRLCASCPVPLLGGGGTGDGDPCTFRTLNQGIPVVQVTPVSPHRCGSPNALLNTLRSLAAVDEPNESTIAMVLPRPSMPLACNPA